jgi:hypothetical protein
MPFARLLAITASLSLSVGATRWSAAQEPKRRGETFAVWFRSDARPVQRVLAAPVDAVWAQLPRAFTDLSYAGGRSARNAERVYLTPSMTIRGRLYTGELNSVYIDCGRTPVGSAAADDYAVSFAILARLTPQDSSTTLVEIVVDGTAHDRTQSSSAVFCTGTGRLEAGLLQRLEERLRTAS